MRPLLSEGLEDVIVPLVISKLVSWICTVAALYCDVPYDPSVVTNAKFDLEWARRTVGLTFV